MRYKIKFLNENEDEFYFDHSGLDLSPATIDLDSWSYGYDGYTVKLPESDIFNVLRETKDIALIKNMTIYDNTCTFALPGYLYANDVVWIEDELVRLISYAWNIWTVERGYHGTRISSHLIETTNETGISCFMNGRHSPLGMECRIYNEYGTDVFYGYVKEIHSNGAGVDVELDNILNKFEGDMLYIGRDVWRDGSCYYFLLHKGLSEIVNIKQLTRSNEWSMLNNIVDYEANLSSASPGTILQQLLLANAAFLVYDNGIFKVHKLQHMSSFNADTAIDLPSKIRFTGGYVSKLTNTGKGCKVTYVEEVGNAFSGASDKQGTIYARPSSLMGAYAKDYMEVDISGIYKHWNSPVLNREEAMSVGKRFTSLFGLSLGQFEVDVTPLHGLVAGSYYTVPEAHEIYNYIPSTIDAVLLCLGITDQRATFIALEGVLHNPVAPAIPFTSNSTTTITQVGDAFNYVECEDADVKYARNEGWDFTYFKEGDTVTLYTQTAQSFVGNFVIHSFPSARTITFTTSVPVTRDVYMTYPEYALASTDQKKFLYNDEGSL